MVNHPPLYPLLALDTSSRRVWAGLKLAPQSLLCETSEADPSQSLFEAVSSLLRRGKCPLSAVASFVYCEGPGSMLGARTAVMAIRTWAGIGIPAARRLFAYNSLRLGRELVARSEFAERECLIATDARRASWNVLPYAPGAEASDLKLLANEDLERETRPLITFSEFARWTRVSAPLSELSYDPTCCFETELFLRFVRPVPEASPMSVRASDFKKWTPRIHSASEV